MSKRKLSQVGVGETSDGGSGRKRTATVSQVSPSYSLRVILYKSLLDMQSFPGSSFLDAESEFIRFNLPKVTLSADGKVSKLAYENAGKSDGQQKSSKKNAFFMPSMFAQRTFQKMGFANPQGMDKLGSDEGIVLREIPFGIDSIDTRFHMNVKELPNANKIELVIDVPYQYKQYNPLQQKVFCTTSKIDITKLIQRWLSEEADWNFRNQTTRDEVVPWNANIETVGMMMKGDVKQSFPQLTQILAMDKKMEILEYDDGLFKNEMGKIFVRIDFLNKAQIALEEGRGMQPEIVLETEIVDVMRGNFGHVLVDHFTKLYHPPTGALRQFYKSPPSLQHAINELSKICTPTSFGLLLDLACQHSNNPIEESLEALMLVNKRIKKADYQSKARWEEVFRNTETKTLKFLDQIPNLPSSPYYSEQKKKLLEGIPKLAVNVGSKATTGHPVVRDHVAERWERSSTLRFFNKEVKFVSTNKYLKYFTRPKTLFFGHLLSYLFFVIVLSFPFFVEQDTSFFYYNYLDGKLAAGFRDISDIDSFWDWAINTLGGNVIEPPERTGVSVPIDRAYIRQFRAKEKECAFPNPYFNVTCGGQPNMLDDKFDKSPIWKSTVFSYSIGTPVNTGNFISLPSGGYYTDLSITSSEAFMERLEDLKNDTWVDTSTRAVIIEITLYSPNDDLFCLVRYLVEFGAAGSVYPSLTYYFLDQTDLENKFIPDENSQSLDYFGFFILLMVIGFLLLEVRELLEEGVGGYLTDFWNYSDIIFFVGSLLVYLIKGFLPGYLDPYATTSFVVYYWWDFVFGRKVAYGIFTLWAYIRIMQYMRFNKKTGPLVIVMKELVRDVFNFVFLFGVVVLGWSIIMTQLLQSYTPAYKNIMQSVFSLVQGGFGNYEYIDLDTGGSSLPESLANAFYCLYLLLALILLINLLIAMMGTTYSGIIEEASEQWGFEFTQVVLYYEKSVWVPPFNIIGETYALFMWSLNRLTCGFIGERVDMPSESSFVLIPGRFSKNKKQAPAPTNTNILSADTLKRLLYPSTITTWGVKLEVVEEIEIIPPPIEDTILATRPPLPDEYYLPRSRRDDDDVTASGGDKDESSSEETAKIIKHQISTVDLDSGHSRNSMNSNVISPVSDQSSEEEEMDELSAGDSSNSKSSSE